jgi:hypothetical protein
MAKQIIVIWEDYDRGTESSYLAHEVLNDSDKGKAEAINLVDSHPDAIVIYGEICKVVKKHTEIELPGKGGTNEN